MTRKDYFHGRSVASLAHNTLVEFENSSWRVQREGALASTHSNNRGNIINYQTHTVQLADVSGFGYFSPNWNYALSASKHFKCIVKLSGQEQRTPAFYYGSINGKAPDYYTISEIKSILNIEYSRKQVERECQPHAANEDRVSIMAEGYVNNFVGLAQQLKDTYIEHGGDTEDMKPLDDITNKYRVIAGKYALTQYEEYLKEEAEKEKQAKIMSLVKEFGLTPEQYSKFLEMQKVIENL